MNALLLMLVSMAVAFLAAKKAQLGNVPGAIIGASIFGVGSFAVLKLEGVPRELWFTFILKFFSVTAYKLVAVVLVSYLIKDCHLSDSEAQWVWAAWGMFMSIATIMAGSITDAIGLRRTLLLGVSICLASRGVMVFSPGSWISLICGMIPLAIGEALCTPVLVAAARKFTSADQRSVAFSVFYAILNLGFMVGLFLRDGVMEAFPSGATILVGIDLSPQRLLLFISLGIEILTIPFIFLLRQGAEVTPEGLRITPDAPHDEGGSTLAAFRLTMQDAIRNTKRLLGILVNHPGFYRLLAFLALIGILKMVFSIMDGVLTTFVERELGPEGASRVGRFNAVNSILILILAPLAGMLTRRFSAYSMVILGGFITAFSFIFMALPPAAFASLTAGSVGEWIGRSYLGLTGVIHPYFIMIVLWQVGFSFGEALYSPRVYEYAVSIAPKGQEASYASLSAVPLLMGKLVTGVAFSGLLTRYCPAEGPRDSSTMWSIVGSLVLISPLVLLFFQRSIRVAEEGRYPFKL